MTPIQSKATEYLSHFELKTRNEGTDKAESYWSLKEDRPERLRDIVYAAHNGMMPDDIKYDYVYQALSMIADYEDLDSAYCEIEADIYHGQLTHWLNTNLSRAEYVDNYLQMFGTCDSIMAAIAGGQIEERREIFSIIRQELENDLEQLDAA